MAKTRVTAQIDDRDLRELDRIADQDRRTRSSLVAEAVARYVAQRREEEARRQR